MTANYDFSCARPGCKAHVHVTIYAHDAQALDVDQLARALGFQRDAPFVRSPWLCVTHETEAPRG